MASANLEVVRDADGGASLVGVVDGVHVTLATVNASVLDGLGVKPAADEGDGATTPSPPVPQAQEAGGPGAQKRGRLSNNDLCCVVGHVVELEGILRARCHDAVERQGGIDIHIKGP